MVCGNQMRCEQNFPGDPPDRGLKSSASNIIRLCTKHTIELTEQLNLQGISK